MSWKLQFPYSQAHRLLSVVYFTEFGGGFTCKLNSSILILKRTRRVEDGPISILVKSDCHVLLSVSSFDHTLRMTTPPRDPKGAHLRGPLRAARIVTALRLGHMPRDLTTWVQTPPSHMRAGSLLAPPLPSKQVRDPLGSETNVPSHTVNTHREESMMPFAQGLRPPRSQPKYATAKHPHEIQCFPSAKISSSFSGHQCS